MSQPVSPRKVGPCLTLPYFFSTVEYVHSATSNKHLLLLLMKKKKYSQGHPSGIRKKLLKNWRWNKAGLAGPFPVFLGGACLELSDPLEGGVWAGPCLSLMDHLLLIRMIITHQGT